MKIITCILTCTHTFMFIIYIYIYIHTYISGFLPGKYCKTVSLLKMSFHFLRGHVVCDGSNWRGGRCEPPPPPPPPKGVRGLSPLIFVKFYTIETRRQETASPVLKTDSVDTVFAFYYARKMQPATLNHTFRAILHIQQPFYFIYVFNFIFWKIELRNSI